MDTQRWQRVSAIFDEVAEAEPAVRAELLQRLCAGDQALRGEVEALLAADVRAAHFDQGVNSARVAVAADWLDSEERARPHTGKRIGPWAVVREIGRGGMGVVLLAERADGQFAQRAAVKLIKRGMDSEAVLARFLRERQILARLEHPHIARLLDGGLAADGRPYFAMEFVDGEPLLRHSAEKNVSLEERIQLFLAICAAVQFAHGQLVVHRDIKPSNILVTASGDAKLLDFGIAKLLDEPSGDAATATADALHRPLTPAYAAPEQLRGEPVTTATDIYALGCVLYELLTGRRPFLIDDSATAQDVIRAQETTQPVPPSKAATDANAIPARRLRGDLDTIALTALRREPERRYATVAALADDLQRYLSGQPIVARRDHTWYRVGKFVARHKLGVASAMAGIALLVAALGFAIWQARAKSREAQVSQQVTQFLVGLFNGADPTTSHGATVTAQDLLDRGAERLRTETHIQPGVRARLLDTVATTYTALGLYDRALPLAQESVDLRRAEPQGDADVAESLDTLGEVVRWKGDYAAAEPLLREALARRRAALPANDPAIAESLDHLAGLIRAKGDFKSADTLYSEALQTAEQSRGANSTDTAHYLDDYAANLDDMGRRQEAERLYRRALAIRQSNLGADDAQTAASMINLGVHLDDSGSYVEAEQLLERALSIRRTIFGDAHPLTGYAELALAGVYESLDRKDDCERMAQDALAIFRKSLPEDHPKIGEALNMLGLVQVMKRNYASAASLLSEVHERFEKRLGASHPDTLAAANNLGFALLHAGRFAEAEQVQRSVLAQTREDNGQPTDALDMQNLAATLNEEGKFAEAVALTRRALELRRRQEGESAPNVAVALRSLAAAEELDDMYVEAERDFRAALELAGRVAAARKIGIYEFKVPLADFLVRARRCDEALSLLGAARTELLSTAPPRDPIWEPEIQLLEATCASTPADRARLLAAARVKLRALPGAEIDLYPAAHALFKADRSD